MRKAAVLYSGGKDSTYTIDVLQQEGYEIVCLITVISTNKDSYMLHTPNVELTELSSKALRFPVVVGHTDGKKEEELRDIQRTVRDAKSKFNFDSIASGGIASIYQKERIDAIAENLGLRSVCPLWGLDQSKYLMRLVESGYDFILTSVSAAGLNDHWLGKRIDSECAIRLVGMSQKFGFNAALEGGEAESLVLDCPLFAVERLKIVEARKIWNGYRGTLEIRSAALEKKPVLQI